MPVNLLGKSFLTLKDFKKSEIEYLLKLSEDLKKKKRSGVRGNLLAGKNIALLFEKSSTRTRCAFVVAARDEGGKPEFLGKKDIQLGKKESVADTARVLGRIFDGIEFRGFEHRTVELLAEYSGVPVWNGLTDDFHPTQVLADLLTIKEVHGKIEGISFIYMGDGRNNMANSLLIASAKTGMNCTIISPEQLQPEEKLVGYCEEIAKDSGAIISITDDINAVKGADVIYTDVWVSMGEEDKFKERIDLLMPYQVNKELIEKTENKDVIFLHCLPAYHDKNTKNGMEIYNKYGISEMEVTDEVFESKYSYVFDQAENRLHTIKAVMVATLGNI
ncbi:MAG: ornithine carbamoyltransferase [Halanaerobiaceae bacterium]